MPFAKGQSGNPTGKAKIVLANGKSLRDLAREHTEESITTLISLMRNSEQDTVRRAAAVDLLDRGWGKPAQAVEVTGANGGPIETLDVGKLDETVLRALAAAPVVRETLQ